MALTKLKNPDTEIVKKVTQSLEPLFSKFKISGRIQFSEFKKTITFDLSPRGGRVELEEIKDVEEIW